MEIRFTQRTATGHDDSCRTTLYINTFPGEDWIAHIGPDNWADDPGGYVCRDTVDIIHPYMMAGTWEEVVAEWVRAVRRKLVNEGRAVYNDYGQLFWI